MTAFYNEHDPFAAAWLRCLIEDGLIAPGVVDERSIEDISPDELRPFRQCHFFAGIGVWSLAARQAGWSDDEELWSGSCPCQPFSSAGQGGGFTDQRHLWPAFHYLIEQCAPPIVVGEQVAGPDGDLWLDLVSADLDATGYAFGAAETVAAGFGAPHKRTRNYWLGKRSTLSTLDNASGERRSSQGSRKSTKPESRRRGPELGCLGISGRLGKTNGYWGDCNWILGERGWRAIGPGIEPLANAREVLNRVGTLRGAGNAISIGQAVGFLTSVRELAE